MAKKTKKNLDQITEEDIAKMNDADLIKTLKEGRKDIIESFNEAFKDIAVMKEEESTPEFKEQAKADYDAAVKEFQDAVYEIYTGDRVIEVAQFLQEWNKKYNHWQRQAWKGVIAFDDIITKKIEDLQANPENKSLIFEYAPMMFIYGSMMAPQGTGLEEARLMEVFETDPNGGEDESSHVTYSNILEWIGRKVDGLKAVQNKIQSLQERWTMAETGFMFDFADDSPEVYVKFMDTANNRSRQQ